MEYAMKKNTVINICALLVAVPVSYCVMAATSAAPNDFGLIDRIFDDLVHALGRLNQLTGLLLVTITAVAGVVLEVQRRILKGQNVAKNERTIQTAVLTDQNDTLSAQNDKLAHITQQVEAVKQAVTPDTPKDSP